MEGNKSGLIFPFCLFFLQELNEFLYVNTGGSPVFTVLSRKEQFLAFIYCIKSKQNFHSQSILQIQCYDEF